MPILEEMPCEGALGLEPPVLYPPALGRFPDGPVGRVLRSRRPTTAGITARASYSLWATEQQSPPGRYLLAPARRDFRPLAHGPWGTILVLYQSGGGSQETGGRSDRRSCL